MGEPLKDNFTRVLAQNLSNLLCIKEISFFPWRKEVPRDYRIEVKIIRFDGSPGDKVILEAWWRILTGMERRCSSRVDQPSASP